MVSGVIACLVMTTKKMTIEQVSEEYQVSKTTVRRYIAQGRLRAIRVGPRMIRLDADEVAAALSGERVQVKLRRG
jgi:excisionase family DNA binding protein